MLFVPYPAMRSAVAEAIGADHLEECRDLLSHGFWGCQLVPHSLSLRRACGQKGAHPLQAVGLHRQRGAGRIDARLCISVHYLISIFSRAIFDFSVPLLSFSSHGKSRFCLGTWTNNLYLVRVQIPVPASSIEGVAGGWGGGVFSRSSDVQQPP